MRWSQASVCKDGMSAPLRYLHAQRPPDRLPVARIANDEQFLHAAKAADIQAVESVMDLRYYGSAPQISDVDIADEPKKARGIFSRPALNCLPSHKLCTGPAKYRITIERLSLGSN